MTRTQGPGGRLAPRRGFCSPPVGTDPCSRVPAPAAQAQRWVAALVDGTHRIRLPDAPFNDLRVVLRRSAHQLAALAKDGVWPTRPDSLADRR